MRIVRVICLALVGATGVAEAQGTHDVVIRLHRQGGDTPVRGAVVTLDHDLEAGNTDSAGIVRVPDLDDGGHIIEVVAHGYQSFEYNFRSGPNIPQPLQFELIPVLASDTAKAKGQKTDLTFAAFDARRMKGQGKFFTSAQLNAASGRPLSNLLKEFMHGDSQLAMQPHCYSAVVKDGVRIYPFAGASPPDLDKIFAEQLEGIELYAHSATVPAELKDAAKCGALVLWTHDAPR